MRSLRFLQSMPNVRNVYSQFRSSLFFAFVSLSLSLLLCVSSHSPRLEYHIHIDIVQLEQIITSLESQIRQANNDGDEDREENKKKKQEEWDEAEAAIAFDLQAWILQAILPSTIIRRVEEGQYERKNILAFCFPYIKRALFSFDSNAFSLKKKRSRKIAIIKRGSRYRNMASNRQVWIPTTGTSTTGAYSTGFTVRGGYFHTSSQVDHGTSGLYGYWGLLDES